MKRVFMIAFLFLAAFNVQAQETSLKLACETTTKYIVQAYLLGVERGIPVQESFDKMLQKEDVRKNMMVHSMMTHYFPLVFTERLIITRNSTEIMNNVAVPVLQACYTDLPTWAKFFDKVLVMK